MVAGSHEEMSLRGDRGYGGWHIVGTQSIMKLAKNGKGFLKGKEENERRCHTGDKRRYEVGGLASMGEEATPVG